MIESQTQINDFLCSENCLGRWIWHSGNLLNKTLVPWEFQIINTVPENYFWEKSQHTIVILSKGLYDIHCGVFSTANKIKIALNLNGEILKSDAKKNYTIDDEGNLTKFNYYNKKLKDESFNGIAIRDVFNLPSRARLNLSVFTEGKADGFMSIKKL